MYEIEVRVKFRSAHRLITPYQGKCSNVHGEYYTAIFIFQATETNECGMVADFAKVKKVIKDYTDENFDHAYICHENDEVGKYLLSKGMRVCKLPVNPTAENIAEVLYGFCVGNNNLPKIKKVGIVESTEDSIAWYCE